MDENRNVKEFFGFLGVLQCIFLILKLCKVITWSWWLVLLPALFPIGIFVFALLYVIVRELIGKNEQ